MATLATSAWSWWESATVAQKFDNWVSVGMLASMLPAALVLLAGVQAPYGRYSSATWGLLMNGKLAWVLQELPSFAVPIAFLWANYPSAPTSSLANQLLLTAFCAHYFNRVFIFPFSLRGGKPTPISVFAMALVFTFVNGWIQGRALAVHHVYPAAWLWDPRFVVGLALFCIGLCINVQADRILVNLRKPGEVGYKVPRGGLFELVSGANFFGECIEWTGFAIACWSFPACVFAISVWCNIGPRAIQHHKWYKEKFEDYPKERRALIPFIL